MSAFLGRLGRTCARHKWIVIAVWVVVLAGVGTAGRLAGGAPSADYTVPGTESQTGADVYARAFPGTQNASGQAVFHARRGSFAGPEAVEQIHDALARIRRLPHVSSATDPFAPLSPEVSRNERTAVSTVTYGVGAVELGERDLRALERATAPLRRYGIVTAFAGSPATQAETPDTEFSERVGLLAAVVILLLAFGSVLAAGLPLLTALLGVALGTSVITFLAAVTDVGSEASILAVMIGLGVGIDYSLFVVTRYRRELAAGSDVLESVAAALSPAGSAVVVAGGTVALATLGLAFAGVPFVTTLGWCAALAVVAAVLGATTLLPALLGALGHSVDRWRIPGIGTSAEAVAEADGHLHGWARWSHRVSDHPWPFVILSLALLTLLALPVLSMRFGLLDSSSDPPRSSTRRAYDLLAAGFGPGFNGPFLVVVDRPTGQAQLVRIADSLRDAYGVASVTPPLASSRSDVTVVTVIPSTAPHAPATARLVRRLRDEVLPGALGAGRTRVYVTGLTPALIDLTDRVSGSLPWFILGVVGLSFLLLMAVFRSLLVPLKAAVMNLLSIGAAYGVVVALFQWGWGGTLLDLERAVPIVSFAPMMMFAILFGLSMDYEVFLLSRIREHHLAGENNRSAVASGLTATAKVISSAALIMVSVFAGFVLVDNVFVKMMGVGLAVAVIVDATIVRLVLVPATMALLGEANWWLPRWLDRVLPHLNVEGAQPPPPGSPASPSQSAPTREAEPAVPVGS